MVKIATFAKPENVIANSSTENYSKQLTFKKYILPLLTALTITLLSFIIIFFVTLYIACIISPGVSIDPKTGEEHVVMIIGQTIISIIVSTILSIVTFIYSFKYFRQLTLKNKTNK